MRRRPRPTTCSQSSWVPKARTPRMWVTVVASQPSVSIETETTQRTCSPSRPGLPIVFMTSRRRSSSVISSADRPGERIAQSRLNSSISAAAIFLKAGSSASPDSAQLESGEALEPGAVADVAEDRQLTRDEDAPATGERLLPAGKPVEDELADGRVLADDDEHRRRADPCRLPCLERAEIVAIEAAQGTLEHLGDRPGIAAGVHRRLPEHDHQ